MVNNETLRNWHTLYKAALAETDVQELPSRIEDARNALILRSRELIYSSPNSDGEVEAIDDAMYTLTALQNCLQLNTKDRRRITRTA